MNAMLAVAKKQNTKMEHLNVQNVEVNFLKYKLVIKTDDLNNILDELPEILMQIQFNGKSGGKKTQRKISNT